MLSYWSLILTALASVYFGTHTLKSTAIDETRATLEAALAEHVSLLEALHDDLAGEDPAVDTFRANNLTTTTEQQDALARLISGEDAAVPST